MRHPISARTLTRPADGTRQEDVAVVAQQRPEAWDALVARHDGAVLQSWAWGALKSRFGWKPFRLASGGGQACAQLLIRPYRGLAVAYVPCGPLLSGDWAVDRALIDAIVRIAHAHRAAFVRFEPDTLEGDPRAAAWAAMLRDAGFKPEERTLQPRASIHLGLGPGTKELMSGFSKGHRADVRRAQREGVTVRLGAPADAAILERMLAATNERKPFGFHPATYYRTLLETFGDDACLLIAEHEGQPVGASLNVAFGHRGMYLAAGSTPAGLDHRAAHLLQWQAIRWARRRGVLTWDLWGIADARGRHELAAAQGSLSDAALDQLEAEARRDPLDGVYRFKKGWGGSVVRTLPAFDRVFIAPAYWFWKWRRGEG
ncbi:MAG TPA: peptidoglycan bridge formation glycyltransferase FemA/FemB family protein [Candidatus Limnocylindrales bacterium]|nr:peptidoglycan bridge formation glycyltransferase FemA/FemB family protein [Candidatus Limnocylindrales bacterium]